MFIVHILVRFISFVCLKSWCVCFFVCFFSVQFLATVINLFCSFNTTIAVLQSPRSMCTHHHYYYRRKRRKKKHSDESALQLPLFKLFLLDSISHSLFHYSVIQTILLIVWLRDLFYPGRFQLLRCVVFIEQKTQLIFPLLGFAFIELISRWIGKLNRINSIEWTERAGEREREKSHTQLQFTVFATQFWPDLWLFPNSCVHFHRDSWAYWRDVNFGFNKRIYYAIFFEKDENTLTFTMIKSWSCDFFGFGLKKKCRFRYSVWLIILSSCISDTRTLGRIRVEEMAKIDWIKRFVSFSWNAILY